MSTPPPLIWFNGRLIPEREAVVPVAAHGVLYGDGVFETLRAYEGEPFRLARHLKRLFEGAAVIGLEVEWDPERLARGVCDTLSAQGLRAAAIRVTALRGVGPPGPDPAGCEETILFITARAFPGYPERIYRDGARAVLAGTRRNEGSPLSRVKSTSYLDSILARVEARRAGADEALLLNSRGELAEGSASNVFARCGDRLLTPPVESGCLPGVARREVMEIAPEVGLLAMECPLSLEMLGAADEALLTNSLMEVAPLVSLDGRSIGGGIPGEAARALRQSYQARVVRARMDGPGSDP